jgi:hypothetical protein
MDPHARAEAIVRGSLALVEAPLRAAQLRELLVTSAPAAIAPALEVLCARAEQADPRARECLLSLVDALHAMRAGDGDLREAVQRLREEAAGESHLALERLLRAPPSEGPRAVDPSKAYVPDYGRGRTLTLGERKSLARRPDRDMMARLLLDPHPEVIKRLLANPKLTEDDVVRLASKRPNRADVLSAIAQSEKWMHRSRVRMAVVLNPATPPDVSAPIVTLLMRQELKLVAQTTAVPRGVRALCLEHLERRPPVVIEDDDDVRIQ